MRLISLILVLSPLVITDCSTENSVPHIDAGLPIVLQLGMPSDKFPETEIRLPPNAAKGFRSLVTELRRGRSVHNSILKEPLGIYVVGDHEFCWRGSILYYLTSAESGLEIESLHLAKMAADAYDGRSESIEDLISPLEVLSKLD